MRIRSPRQAFQALLDLLGYEFVHETVTRDDGTVVHKYGTRSKAEASAKGGRTRWWMKSKYRATATFIRRQHGE